MNPCPITVFDHSKRNRAVTPIDERNGFSNGCKDCFCQTPWFDSERDALNHWDAYQEMNLQEWRALAENQ